MGKRVYLKDGSAFSLTVIFYFFFLFASRHRYGINVIVFEYCFLFTETRADFATARETNITRGAST